MEKWKTKTDKKQGGSDYPSLGQYVSNTGILQTTVQAMVIQSIWGNFFNISSKSYEINKQR